MSRSLVQFPLTFRKLICAKLTPNFREAVKLQNICINESDLSPGSVLIKNRYVGINASDINYTAGRYTPGVSPPFDVGMEAIGEVMWTGTKCKSLKPGDTVATSSNGAFAEYTLLPERLAMQIPSLKPEYLAFIISGTTASISLEKVGELKQGETVLVTAAAGGTGQFAVQLARAAGCHVIGTCSSDSKMEFLKSIGCHRPINYHREDLGSVLQSEYPKGINVVYECVGGEVFNACVKSLAVRGRLIIIGMITDYTKKSIQVNPTVPLQQILLSKSASIRGFFLVHYFKELPKYISKLVEMESAGQLKVKVDQGFNRPEGPFCGLQSIPDAVEYLYNKENEGKIVVDLHNDLTSKL